MSSRLTRMPCYLRHRTQIARRDAQKASLCRSIGVGMRNQIARRLRPVLRILYAVAQAATRPCLRTRSASVPRIESLLFKTGALLALLLAVGITPALAAPPTDLNGVIGGIRNWAMGVLFALTTLYLTVAGIRYVMAGGSPHAMEEAKTAVRNSLLGYALAALAPLLADIVKGIVG